MLKYQTLKKILTTQYKRNRSKLLNRKVQANPQKKLIV